MVNQLFKFSLIKLKTELNQQITMPHLQYIIIGTIPLVNRCTM